MADGVAESRGDLVTDDEILFRSVRQEDYRFEDGKCVLASNAFSDRAQRVSFDRAQLRGAEQARKQPDQAVFAIRAGDARAISDVVMNERPYRVEAIASPLPDNPAHAHAQARPIHADTPPLNNEGFKKLKRALAKIAWLASLPLAPNSADDL